MAIFYAPDILKEPILPEDESLHCSKVLRLQAGAEITIIDGAGGLFKAHITVPHAKHTEVEIVDKKYVPEKEYRVHIAIAPTKKLASSLNPDIDFSSVAMKVLDSIFFQYKTISSTYFENMLFNLAVLIHDLI